MEENRLKELGWQEKLVSGEEVTIVTYGDSWTYGSCADGWFEAKAAGYKHEMIYGSWALQLKSYVEALNAKASLINQGQGGWKSITGQTAFNERVAKYEPDLLILNFGINDWRAGVPIEAFRKAMEEMIEEAGNINCECVLWTTGPVSSVRGETFGWDEPEQDTHYPHLFDEYNNVLRSLAEQYRLILIDVEAVIVEKWRKGLVISDFFLDAIHLLQPGHDIILHCMKQSIFNSASNVTDNKG
jgi:lysophospholipase L1-like esterase